MVQGTLQIRIPAWFSASQEQETVDHFQTKFQKRNQAATIDLDRRTNELIRRFGYESPETVRWVSNQQHQWGSCTPTDRSIRISDRLSAYPSWVLDYVLCHELAHLSEANHGADFWALVNRYPLTERARGFLIAKGLEND